MEPQRRDALLPFFTSKCAVAVHSRPTLSSMTIPQVLALLLFAAAIAGVLVAPDIWKHFVERPAARPPLKLTFEERIRQEPRAAAFLMPLISSLDEPRKSSLEHVAAYRHDVPMPTNREELLIAARNAASWTGIAEDKGMITLTGPNSAAGLYALVEYLQGVADAA